MVTRWSSATIIEPTEPGLEADVNLMPAPGRSGVASVGVVVGNQTPASSFAADGFANSSDSNLPFGP